MENSSMALFLCPQFYAYGPLQGRSSNNKAIHFPSEAILAFKSQHMIWKRQFVYSFYLQKQEEKYSLNQYSLLECILFFSKTLQRIQLYIPQKKESKTSIFKRIDHAINTAQES